jgi:hypothetical protein
MSIPRFQNLSWLVQIQMENPFPLKEYKYARRLLDFVFMHA